MTSRWVAVLLLLLCAWPSLAAAAVERYAVIIGNNRGEHGETELLYAESDATRVNDVLRELGGFEPANTVLLRGEDADTVRKTLIAVNDRIRAAMSLPDTQVVLFVYYSGHADADALHLGSSRLGFTELAQLARGSAASFRLVVLDACRSGALTRVKGGTVRAPFELPDERVPNDGLAFLTASAASEDAQESDELRGSFFTHALVSGLLGAADADGDGAVALDEAYRHAYDATLRATSRTLAGTQHPTFRYDFRGQGTLVLTRPEAFGARRATLRLPAGMNVLLMRDGRDGAVVGEIGERGVVRTLSVKPGRYFVRARGRDVMFEGEVEASAGQHLDVDTTELERIEYARLVRKGAGDARASQALEGGLRLRSALPNADVPCLGGFVGYGLDFAELGVLARVSACTAGFDNALAHATTNAYGAEARLYHAWDLPALSLRLGLGGGVNVFTQRFEAPGQAPSRTSAAPFVALGAGAELGFAYGLYTSLDVSAETHFLPLETRSDPSKQLEVAFALSSALAFGKRF